MSRRRLADYHKTLHQKACSTIIFLHSTNQIIDSWRCRWRCRRQILNSLIDIWRPYFDQDILCCILMVSCLCLKLTVLLPSDFALKSVFYCFSLHYLNTIKQVYYTVIKHSEHLRTLLKCRKHSPVARVLNTRRVLSRCNTQLRLLYVLTNPKRWPKRSCVLRMCSYQLELNFWHSWKILPLK